MDLTTIENQLVSLRSAGIPDRPPVTELARRAARRRRRRRAMGSAVAIVALVGLGAGALRLTNDDAQQLETREQRTTTTSTGGSDLSVRVPPVVGKSVGEAAALLENVGLQLSVSDGDAAFTNAVVVAAEPGEAVEVPSGAVIGVRTALPDPPLAVECPSARHPRDGDNPDGLPRADSLDRASAEATVRTLRSSVPDTSDTRVFLGIWDRWAYSDDNGTIATARTTGFQAIVVTPDANRCSTTTTFHAVPVTYVFGDLTWAGDPFPQATVELDGIQVETPSGWSAEQSSNEHGEVLYLRDDSGAELHIVVRPTPSEAPGADEVLSVVSAFGDSSAVITEVEGGYALYAALACPAEPCDQVEVFGYNLSLAEFTELSSSL